MANPRYKLKCEKCDKEIDASKWGRIRAGSEGWFFTRDDRGYCPDHVPEWVAEWRRKKEVGKGNIRE